MAAFLVYEWPQTLSDTLARIVRHAPSSFDDQILGEVVATARRLHESGRPVVELELEAAGAPLRVANLGGISPGPCAAESYADTVWWAYTARQSAELLDGLVTSVCLEPSKALASLPDALRALAGDVDMLTRRGHHNLEARLAARMFRQDSRPPQTSPRYRINGVPVCTPKNLTCVSAAAKSGKSALLGAMIAATMTDDPSCDCLGVEAENPEGHAVLHFDTEQSPEDHWELVDRARRRAGVDELPAFVRSYCLTGFSVHDAKQAIALACEAAMRDFGGIHAILIDGVADLVADVNDAEECNGFVAHLHAEAIRLGAPIVCVLHYNPGTEKTRGHLGSQLERKAETNLKLEKDGETIVVWSDKNRRAPIPKEHGPRFAWSGEAGMHVTVASLASAQDDERQDELRRLAEDSFQLAGRPALPWTDLRDAIQRTSGLKSPSGARKRLELMARRGIVAKSAAGLYVLTRDTTPSNAPGNAPSNAPGVGACQRPDAKALGDKVLHEVTPQRPNAPGVPRNSDPHRGVTFGHQRPDAA